MKFYYFVFVCCSFFTRFSFSQNSVYLLNQAENSIRRDEYSKALEFYNQYTSQKKILEIDDLFNKFYCEALSKKNKAAYKSLVELQARGLCMNYFLMESKLQNFIAALSKKQVKKLKNERKSNNDSKQILIKKLDSLLNVDQDLRRHNELSDFQKINYNNLYKFIEIMEEISIPFEQFFNQQDCNDPFINIEYVPYETLFTHFIKLRDSISKTKILALISTKKLNQIGATFCYDLLFKMFGDSTFFVCAEPILVVNEVDYLNPVVFDFFEKIEANRSILGIKSLRNEYMNIFWKQKLNKKGEKTLFRLSPVQRSVEYDFSRFGFDKFKEKNKLIELTEDNWIKYFEPNIRSHKKRR